MPRKLQSRFPKSCTGVLVAPARSGAGRLHVVSRSHSAAFTVGLIMEILGEPEGFKLISRRLRSLNLSFVFYTLPPDTSRTPAHNAQLKAIMDLTYEMQGAVSIQFVYPDCWPNTTIFLWEMMDVPYLSWRASACFSYKDLLDETSELISEDTENVWQQIQKMQILPSWQNIHFESSATTLLEQKFPVISLSHLNRDGTVSLKSGLNWGKRSEYRRAENQAYIAIPRKIARTGFFPPPDRYFTVVTDDGESFIARIQQQNDKALTTPLDNSILGYYFRRRLGVPSGAEVKMFHLREYNRTDVRFIKLDQETYFMDFSNL